MRTGYFNIEPRSIDIPAEGKRLQKFRDDWMDDLLADSASHRTISIGVSFLRSSIVVGAIRVNRLTAREFSRKLTQ